MTDIEEENTLKEKNHGKLLVIRAAVDRIDDYLNTPKLKKLSKLITRISRFMRKFGNQLSPPFDLIATVQVQTEIIKEEVNDLELIVNKWKTPSGVELERMNAPIELIQRIWKARVEKKNIILFLAPFYNENYLKDGYYRRIKAIDDIWGHDFLKIYVAPTSYVLDQVNYQSFLDSSHIVLNLDFENSEQIKLLELLANMSDLLYYHSIAFLNEITLYTNTLQILDLHGSVPEELALMGYREQAKLGNEKERAALEKVDYVIVVSHAMSKHLQRKYPESKVKYITLPIVDSYITQIGRNQKPKPLKNGKQNVIYVGGLQKWQMIPKMQSLINKTYELYNYQILVPSPGDFINYWKGSEPPNLSVSSGDQEEVEKLCDKAHYGLLLRENIVVNRVSCPTKLIEYLAYGVVPVLISKTIGDFSELGMKYICLSDLKSGKLPTEEERLKLVKDNYECLDKIINMYEIGKTCLLDLHIRHNC